MRLGVVPENFLERLMLLCGLPPVGVFESWFGLMLTRAIMAATKLGVFESLANGPLSVAEIAAHCEADVIAMQRLLNALVGARCLKQRRGCYELPKRSREWLLRGGKHSFHDQILLHYLEWEWWAHCEDYVRSGQPLDIHATMNNEQWGVYQRGMRAGIELPAEWIARSLPLPKQADSMLDIGGGHGYFSVAICRRRPLLKSTILELPEAIEHAAPLLAKEGLGPRVVYQAGDARRDDLGRGVYDLIFLSAIVHHFDEPTNRELMRRIAQALRPGGIVAIWEAVRQGEGNKIRQVGGLLDLFFGMFSRSGSWSAKEIASWYRGAGLVAERPRQPPLMRDLALHVGRNPK